MLQRPLGFKGKIHWKKPTLTATHPLRLFRTVSEFRVCERHVWMDSNPFRGGQIDWEILQVCQVTLNIAYSRLLSLGVARIWDG